MSKQHSSGSPVFPSFRVQKLIRLVVIPILLLGLCLSAAVPVSTVSSHSSGTDAQRPHQAVVDACLTPTLTTDTIWTAGNTYQAANCVVTVNAGVTLTVQGGAMVQFGGASYGMKVLGTLIAEGNSSSPVVFTSASDIAANTWYGIVLYENSAASFDYASIRYGGSGVCAGGYEDTTYNSCYSRAQVDVRKANLQMVHSEVRDGHTDGITLDAPGKTPYIQETTIANNTNGIPTDIVGQAIDQTTINMQPDYLNLVFTGNDFNKVGIKIAQLNQDVNLGGAPLRFYCGFTSCPIEIPSGRTLTVQPGADLDFTAVNATLSVLAGGTLLIQGNQSHPVTINEAGIDVAYGGMAQVSYADVDGGGRVYYGLYDRADGVTVNNSTFHDFYINGIYIYSEANHSLQLTMNAVNLLNNASYGIHITTGTGSTFDMSLEGGNIAGNARNGIAVGGGPVSVALKNVEISGNGFGGSDGSVQNGIYANTNNVSLDLENVQFLNNKNESVYWNGNGSIRARNLTATGNTRNALALAGCVISTGREWDLADAGIPVIVTNNITVDTGGILSITPGSTLGFEAGKKLQVNQDGALYALGTADDPIVFSRAYGTQTGATAWFGLTNYKGTMILRHCEVSYCDYDSAYGGWGTAITVGASSTTPTTKTIIQNCKVHHNDVGILAYAPTFATTTIVYNELYNNPMSAVNNNGFGPEIIDAYYNYWGDPTGPHHATLNPGGLGNPVGNNVNFTPFLTTPPEESTLVGEMWVSSAGPAQISPGEVNDYAIQYLNLTAEPIYHAVAVIQLPLAGKYLSSTEGGVYWPARHQVFWLLNDIDPSTQAMLTARVRYDWGLAPSYRDGSYTLLAGTNYQSDKLNLDDYYGYAPDGIASILPMDQAAFDALRSGNADLNTLYNTAISEGFAFIEAYSTSFDNGDLTKTAMMRTPDKKSARMLILTGSEALAITTDGSTFYRIQSVSGGQLTNLQTLERTTWGEWADAQGGQSVTVECNYARCMRNCSLKTISIEMMKDTAKGAGVWLLGLPAVSGLLVTAWGVYEGVSLVHDVYVCHEGCSLNPQTGCCNAGETLWSPSFISGYSMCERYVCGSSLSFPAAPNGTTTCGSGSRCVAGYNEHGGCKPCTEESGTLSLKLGPVQTCSYNGLNASLPKCSDLTIRQAKDPNALYGPAGDLLPDEVINYRITYENEGEGDAYGVYIINQLPAQLDETSLVLNNGGVYMPEERQIFWYVGHLGPKGDPTSLGEVTYSVTPKVSLAAGTAIVNQATVYFPSVPEETPTNTWSNLVYPIAAIPQDLETDYMTPLDITLDGKPAGGLSFNLESLPMGGTLTGTLPNLTYTPVENFSGVDFFTFAVSKAGETSQPAQVTIQVSSTGDTASPTVLWVSPEDHATGVALGGTPLYTIPEGDVYQPVLVAKLSEQIDEASIDTVSVIVIEAGGGAVLSKASFDPATQQLTIQLLRSLKSAKTYTVSLSAAIMDLAGNSLAPYSWQFTTGSLPGSNSYLPLISR